MKKLLFLPLIALAISCGAPSEKTSEIAELPILGERYVDDNQDTVYHSIADFAFVNQLGDTIRKEDMAGKIYVADFFFTTCHTICPKMKTQMLRIYERYKDRDEVRIISHSIDPDFDTPNVLKDYAARLQVKAPKWNLLTGDKAAIYTLGQKSYMVSAQEDPNEAGGFVHSGAFILVDKNRHVRGIYDGTVEAEVNHLLEDMENLLKEL